MRDLRLKEKFKAYKKAKSEKEKELSGLHDKRSAEDIQLKESL